MYVQLSLGHDCADSLQPPTAFNKPVEDHLRDGVRNYLQTTGLRRKPVKPYANPLAKTTLRASHRYEVVEESKRSERRLKQLKQIDSRAFSAGGRPRQPKYVESIANGEPFDEAWKLARGQRDLENSMPMKAQRVSTAPFHTRTKKLASFEDMERERARMELAMKQDKTLNGSLSGGSSTFGRRTQSASARARAPGSLKPIKRK